MFRYAMDKRLLIKSIALSAVLFFVSLRAMEPEEPVKDKKQLPQKKMARKVRVDCGLFSESIPLDVVKDYVKKNLGLQDVGRIKQVSKTCNEYWNIYRMCLSPQGCADICPMLVCQQIVADFDTCSKFLAYYAQHNNKEMFKHLYDHDQKKRDENVAKILKIKRPILKNCMDVYRGDVSDEDEKICTRSRKLAKALHTKDREAVNILLLHKNFGISGGTGFFDTLLKAACEFGDIEILFQIIGGIKNINEVDCFNNAAIHYAFKNDTLFSQLMEYGADVNKLDRAGKTVLFYAVDEKGTVDDLRRVLKWKPDMNIVCEEGSTVAHRAIISYKVYDDYDVEKIDLLLGAGIDIHLPNRAGHTFLDYVPHSGYHKKKAVKALLKKHKIKREKEKIRWTKPAAEGGSGYKGSLRS